VKELFSAFGARVVFVCLFDDGGGRNPRSPRHLAPRVARGGAQRRGCDEGERNAIRMKRLFLFGSPGTCNPT
jgi:hypothetical protein